jgi:hypothetical protein
MNDPHPAFEISEMGQTLSHSLVYTVRPLAPPEDEQGKLFFCSLGWGQPSLSYPLSHRVSGEDGLGLWKMPGRTFEREENTVHNFPENSIAQSREGVLFVDGRFVPADPGH